MTKELSSKREDFVVNEASRETAAESMATFAPAILAAAPSAAPGIQECWVEVDGARMRYLRAGSGPALILAHGLLGYSFSWRYTMPALAPYATVYAPDMLGAGFSDRPDGLDCRLCAVARRLLRFAEKLGLSSFDLLGTSHGGAVAMMAAAQSLESVQGSSPRVKRLILVAPVNPYSAHGRRLAPFLGSRIGSVLFLYTVARMRFLYRYWLVRLYGDPKRIPPGTLEGYMSPLAVPGLFDHGVSVVRSWTEDMRALETILPKLRKIPTLLLWGSEDPAVYAASAEPLAKHFQNSQVKIFPGVGHLPYEECPEEFNRALIEFLMQDGAAG